ncbi:MAG: hypothetical protein ABIM89_04705 [Mycobacteriales bacterium]
MPPEDSGLPRRRALAGLIAVAATSLAACTKRKGPSTVKPTGAAPSGFSGSTPGESPSPSPSATPPDPTAIAAARAREIALLTAYDAAARDIPAAAALLADFRAHHAAHLERIQTLRGAPSPGLTVPAEPTRETPSTSSSTSSKAAAAKARAVFAQLAKLERTAAADGAAACAAAGPTDFAVLLAEIAGSESQHSALLPTFPAPVPS